MNPTDDNFRYEDIVDLPHPEPQNHLRMPPEARAAQFSPFAALKRGVDELSGDSENDD